MRVVDKVKFTPGGVPAQYYYAHNDIGLKLHPPIDPATGTPIGPDFLNFMAPSLLGQEVSDQVLVDVPEAVLEVYAKYRPTPLLRATRFEKALGTKCRVYYKYEGATPLGSHKINSALPQAYYAKRDGAKLLTTETGGGQWGTALAFAAHYFDLPLIVFMVKCSYESKPVRRTAIELYGSEIHPSPSDFTQAGRDVLAEDPNNPGSLGLAISEAVEYAKTHKDTYYVLGSVLNHVLLHQSIIGLEAQHQLAQLGVDPDEVIGCHGGGSNFGGLIAPFMTERHGGKDIRITAVEPSSCPTLTEGEYRYDFPDTAEILPKIKMYTLGNHFLPSPIHAGGLRFHGASPIISEALHQGLINAIALPQSRTFADAVLFARCEGIIPAPESSHAIAGVIERIKQADAEGQAKTFLIGISGTGLMEIPAYASFLDNKLD